MIHKPRASALESKTKEEKPDPLYKKRMRCFGRGLIDTSMSLPCPFCYEPDLLVYRIIECDEVWKKGATCRNCGRAIKAIFHDDNVEFVQTGGPDPDHTSSFFPPIRRAAGTPP